MVRISPVCYTCGIELKGIGKRTNYCSPTCRDRAEQRRFKTEYGGEVGIQRPEYDQDD